jgi:hypothetical protein
LPKDRTPVFTGVTAFQKTVKIDIFIRPAIPVDYFSGYHIMRRVKIKRIIAQCRMSGIFIAGSQPDIEVHNSNPGAGKQADAFFRHAAKNGEGRLWHSEKSPTAWER